MKYRFTRVELVCLLALTALLAALALPLSGRAAGAGTVRCLDRLARLNRGFLQYAADNDDYFPTGSPPDYQAVWTVPLAPYVGVKAEPGAPAAAFTCPDDPTSTRLTYSGLLHKKSSYGINGYGVCRDSRTGRGVRRSQVKNPDMIVLADAPGWLIVGYAGEGPARIPAARHAGGRAVNVLFFHGGAETVKVTLSVPADIYKEGNLPAAYWSNSL